MAKTNQEKKIRVLLADDHPLLRAGFTAALTKQDIEVVSLVERPEEVITTYEKLKPDVLVLDIMFNNEAIGLDLGKSLIEKYSNAKIVFLSQFDYDVHIKEAYHIGGMAFINKALAPSELETAIRKAHIGTVYMPSTIAERIAYLAVRKNNSPIDILDEREIEILKLTAQGYIHSEMPEKTGLSLRTITNINQSIKEKLGISRPADLARLAIRYKLVELEN